MGALVALASVLSAFLLVSIRGFPRASVLLGAVCVASAAVFLALVAFVHPSGDDYDFALAMRGRDPWSVVSQFYHQWSGRFSAILVTSVVTSLHPLAWACRIALIAVVVIEAAALVAIIRVGSARSVSRAQAAWAALVVLCVCAGSMPSTAEGLYWTSAVLGYGLGFAALLALCAVLLSLPARWSLPLGSVMACGCAGFNETTMMLTGTMLAAGVVHERLARGRWSMPWIAALAALTVGAAIALAAPGNGARMARIGHTPDVFQALQVTIGTWVRCLGEWSSQPQVLLLAVCVVAARWSQPALGLRLRIVIPAWLLGIAAACAPAAYALASAPPPRALDAIFAYFLVGVVVVVAEATPRVSAWWHDSATAPRSRRRLGAAIAGAIVLFAAAGSSISGETLLLVAAVVILALAAWLRARRLEGGVARWLSRPGVVASLAQVSLAGCLIVSGNVPQAVVDLIIHAPLRSRDLDRREAWLGAQRHDVRARVPLPDPAHRPRTIAYIDITSDPHAWMNRSYAEYFGVSDIAIDPRLSAPAVAPAR